MSRPDKAVEPSMEEILASIRKIISEEPIGTRPSPSDGQAPTGEFGRYEPGADPAVPPLQPAPRRVEAVGLDDVLGLAQGSAADVAGGTAGRPTGLAKPAASEPRVSLPAGDGSPSATNGAVPASPGGPDTAKPSASTSPRHANGQAGTHETAASIPRPADDAAKAPRPSVDADAALSEARAKIERHLGTPPKVDAAPLPGLKSIRDMEFRGLKPRPDAETRPKSTADGLMARVAAAGAQREMPAAGAQRETSAAGAQRETSAAGARPETALAGPDAPAAAKAAPDQTTVGQTAPGQSAPGKTAEAPPARDEPAKMPPAAATPDPDRQTTQPHPAQRPAQTAPAGAAPASGERARAFEDAVAEMLRPMLREWLDANLPRLAQQALREEMAKSSLPGKDNRGS